jgi:hypothetical protein
LERTGAPDNLWFVAQDYLSHVHNLSVNRQLSWKIPEQVLRGREEDARHIPYYDVMKNKSDLKTRIKTLLTDLKIANLIVKFIRCDDAGENMTMKNDPEIKSFGIKFEFLGSRTPQRNGKVERKLC